MFLGGKSTFATLTKSFSNVIAHKDLNGIRENNSILVEYKFSLSWRTGNPADGASYLFAPKIDQKLSKNKYGVNKAAKLENITHTTLTFNNLCINNS